MSQHRCRASDDRQPQTDAIPTRIELRKFIEDPLPHFGSEADPGNRVQGVEADRIMFEQTATRRDKPGQIWGPPIWEFKPKVG
jgi:hypothetical protein